MSLYNIVNAASLQAGKPEDVSQVLANFEAIQTILNGGIDDANVRSTAAINATKLNVPGDITKFLRGDGAWETAGSHLLWDSIASGVTLPAAAIQTPLIDQSFKHLICFVTARSDDTASEIGGLYVRLKDTTGAANFQGWAQIDNTDGVATDNDGEGNSQQLIGNCGTSSAAVGHRTDSGTVIFISNYTLSPTLMSLSYIWYNSSSTKSGLKVSGQQALISNLGYLNFYPNTGNFTVDTRITLYGLG